MPLRLPTGVTESAVVPENMRPSESRQIEVGPAALSQVFHRLNNQLGVILANAELLEARLTEETQRARAGQVVSGALEAISAIQDLRRLVSQQNPTLR